MIDEPVVGDFFKEVKAIFHDEGYTHMTHPDILSDIGFVLNKLEFLERIYKLNQLDFTRLAWIREYYRS